MYYNLKYLKLAENLTPLSRLYKYKQALMQIYEGCPEKIQPYTPLFFLLRVCILSGQLSYVQKCLFYCDSFHSSKKLESGDSKRWIYE